MFNKFTKIIRITRTDSKRMIRKLLHQIKNSGESFTKVVGIENGGLNVSIPIAKSLKLPHHSIKISFYGKSNKRKYKPTIRLNGIRFKKSDNILLIDDIVDSGASILWFKERFSKVMHKVGVFHWNKKGEYGIEPDFYAAEKEPDQWVTYYWEV